MNNELVFSVPSITCPSCIESIKAILVGQKAFTIKVISYDILEKTVNVNVEGKQSEIDEIVQLIENALEDGGFENASLLKEINNQPSDAWTHLLKGLAGAGAGGVLMGLMLAGIAMPVMVMYGLYGLSTFLTLYLGKESFIDSSKKFVKSRTLTMDSLFTLSTLTIITVSTFSIFFPSLPMMMDGGLMIFGFRHLGKWIEEKLKGKIVKSTSFKQRLPTKAKRMCMNGETENVDLQDIKPGDVILVPKNALIPVDGILKKDALIEDTIITGAIMPRSKKTNDPVLSGMRTDAGNEAMIEVKKSANRSYLARLDASIRKAHAEKAPIEEITNKILQYFIPAVLGVAVVAFATVSVLINPALAISCAATILISACPCTLGFITPLAMKLGMAKAASHGIQFKSAKSLQAAATINTVVFDLNGTLTQGTPTVTDYKIYQPNKCASQEFFKLLLALEKNSPHLVGRAIENFSKRQNQNLQAFDLVETQQETNAIKGKLGQDHYLIGNISALIKAGIDIGNVKSPQLAPGSQCIYLVKNKEILGHITVSDPLRPEAKSTIEILTQMGKEVHICTGADKKTALGYAKILGIAAQNVVADCTGEAHSGDQSKVGYIKTLEEKNKKVAMVGDAGNDAHAIATSDFGIAIRSQAADEMTQQEAGATLFSSNLMSIPKTLQLAEQTMKNIKENLMISLTYNAGIMIVGGIAVGIGFALNPGIGVALMIMQTTFVLLNQYRFKQKPLITPTTTNEYQQNSSTADMYRCGMPLQIGLNSSLKNDEVCNLPSSRLEVTTPMPKKLPESSKLSFGRP